MVSATFERVLNAGKSICLSEIFVVLIKLGQIRGWGFEISEQDKFVFISFQCRNSKWQQVVFVLQFCSKFFVQNSKFSKMTNSRLGFGTFSSLLLSSFLLVLVLFLVVVSDPHPYPQVVSNGWHHCQFSHVLGL